MRDRDPATICRNMARLERETYEAWLARTIAEAAERAEKAKTEKQRNG